METGTGCHDSVIRVDEVGTHELGTNLLLFNFQGSERGTSKVFEKEATLNGGVAQLGEHLPCKQGVMGSNPIISTIFQGKGIYACDLKNHEDVWE